MPSAEANATTFANLHKLRYESREQCKFSITECLGDVMAHRLVCRHSANRASECWMSYLNCLEESCALGNEVMSNRRFYTWMINWKTRGRTVNDTCCQLIRYRPQCYFKALGNISNKFIVLKGHARSTMVENFLTTKQQKGIGAVYLIKWQVNSTQSQELRHTGKMFQETSNRLDYIHRNSTNEDFY